MMFEIMDKNAKKMPKTIIRKKQRETMGYTAGTNHPHTPRGSDSPEWNVELTERCFFLHESVLLSKEFGAHGNIFFDSIFMYSL